MRFQTHRVYFIPEGSIDEKDERLQITNCEPFFPPLNLPKDEQMWRIKLIGKSSTNIAVLLISESRKNPQVPENFREKSYFSESVCLSAVIVEMETY